MSFELTNIINKNSSVSSAVPLEATQNVHSNHVKTNNIALKAFDAIGSFFYQGIHKVIGFVVLPAQNPLLFLFENIKSKKEYLINQRNGEEIKFQTPDDTTLDGMYFQGRGCQKSDRTVILFNGNGVRYEQYGGDSFLFDIESWKKNGWNVVIFNYRGVGQSKGIATRDGLILDGDTVFQHVRDQFNVSEDKILLHGHSLGGGIASEVAAKHPNVNYCNDRSFSSLSKQVKVMFGNGIIGSIASKVLTYFGWEYKARDNWDKINGKKFSIYHEKDSVIPEGARFYESLENDNVKIKLHSAWIKNGKNSLPDDPKLVDDLIKKNKFGFFNKMELNLLKLQTGQVAHMRKYNVLDEIHYFQKINTI